jgi:hypothetical protein
VIAPFGNFGEILNDPGIAIDVSISLGYLKQFEVGVETVVNLAKIAAALYVNAANPADTLEAADIATAAAVPGVTILACTVGGASSVTSPNGEPYMVLANSIIVRNVRMSYN